MKTVVLTKIKEADKPLHPNNIAEGVVKRGYYEGDPKVGECFYIGGYWRTSTVQEIISPDTFRTHNSIYHWKIED